MTLETVPVDARARFATSAIVAIESFFNSSYLIMTIRSYVRLSSSLVTEAGGIWIVITLPVDFTSLTSGVTAFR
jgi:hypothetical protein